MPESEDEIAKELKAWEVWYTNLGKAVADPGNPITPAKKKIASNGAVSDGSIAPTATGYTIVEAKSIDDAVKMAKGCPVLKSGAEVSVFETFEVMS